MAKIADKMSELKLNDFGKKLYQTYTLEQKYSEKYALKIEKKFIEQALKELGKEFKEENVNEVYEILCIYESNHQ